MPQLSLYIDDLTMERLRKRSLHEHTSLSKCANQLINKQLNSSSWPNDYWSIYGALDDPTFEIPEDINTSLDGQVSFDAA